MTRFTALQLRAGYDLALSDTYSVEAFTPTGGAPKTVKLLGFGSVYIYARYAGRDQYSAGQERIDPVGGFSYAGNATVPYITEKMHIDSFTWLKATYSGAVSAHLRSTLSTYADWNCQLRFVLSETPDIEYVNVRWLFTLVEAI